MTVHLTNFASRKLHRGTVYSIMVRPRAWEHGAGRVYALTPAAADLADVRAERITVDEYRRRFQGGIAADLTPGVLHARRTLGDVPVADGDTLCCACSRDAAARGECHRAWCVPFLRAAGWAVVLDGVEVAGG